MQQRICGTKPNTKVIYLNPYILIITLNMYGLTSPIFVKENITQDIERKPNPMLSTTITHFKYEDTGRLKAETDKKKKRFIM